MDDGLVEMSSMAHQLPLRLASSSDRSWFCRTRVVTLEPSPDVFLLTSEGGLASSPCLIAAGLGTKGRRREASLVMTIGHYMALQKTAGRGLDESIRVACT